MNLDVVYLERPADEGLTQNEIIQLLKKLSSDTNEQFVPFEHINSNLSSAAIGFMKISSFDKMNSTDIIQLNRFIIDILDDMDKETPDHTYSLKTESGLIHIWMDRNL